MKTSKVNILLPTDFSDNAWSAAVYAFKLYADKECTFYFLHANVNGTKTVSNITKALLSTMDEKAMKEVRELKEMAEVSNANANHEFEIVLSSEKLLKAIEVEVEKHKIDLVIMGTRGSTGTKEFFYGSNTVHIINKMRLCPVLVVPDEYDFIEPKQIAFPTDFNRFYDEKQMNYLKLLADLFNSHIRIVHIKTEKQLDEIQEYNYAKLKEQLEDYNFSFHWMPDYTKKVDEIHIFIEDLKINILVMINYRHSLIESIVKEPVIKKLGFRPIIPFLVIPD